MVAQFQRFVSDLTQHALPLLTADLQTFAYRAMHDWNLVSERKEFWAQQWLSILRKSARRFCRECQEAAWQSEFSSGMYSHSQVLRSKKNWDMFNPRMFVKVITCADMCKTVLKHFEMLVGGPAWHLLIFQGSCLRSCSCREMTYACSCREQLASPKISGSKRWSEEHCW